MFEFNKNWCLSRLLLQNQINFRAGLCSIKKGIPPARNLIKNLLHTKSFPARSDSRMSHQVINCIYSEKSVQYPAVPNINFRNFNEPFFYIGIERLKLTNHKSFL